MRGRVHQLTLVSLRGVTGAATGAVVRDAEGRWRSPAGGVEGEVSRRVYTGFCGSPKTKEIAVGLEVDAAAQLPRGTPVVAGDDLEVSGTGDERDGRYEIVSVQEGPVMTRVLLKRWVVADA